MGKEIEFMREALKLARIARDKDEVPIGAVVVCGNKIIAKGYNQVEELCDPTAHAEMIAITSATSFLKSKWLKDCTLYVTIEPCVMCASALILSRIKEVVWGADDVKAGAFGSKIDVNKLKLNHQIKVKKGILSEECSQIIKDFFKQKRAQLN
ncbi:MAG: tRNA-specific adenosine deaminase [Candidatus Omnitrophica bacterium 4484_70.2]|nr:MAG: tRNA-specific adenosine deaminase [Candidatus Omnitrophica bacterium 4484_70.2]